VSFLRILAPGAATPAPTASGARKREPA
jgi:hypothetical protein